MQTQIAPQKYLTNKALLAEIHKSKKTYCYFVDPLYSDYDVIVKSLAEVTEDLGREVLDKKASARRKNPADASKTVEDLVFRVHTYEHVPLCGDKKRRSRTADGEGHLRTNFPPFKHYILKNGEPIEVGRSHWVNGLDNGYFSLDHGRLTNKLAHMFLLLVERYGRKANWRNYTYIDEMRSSALLQLATVGLQFDEFRGDNPFAYYTQVMKSCFTRVFNLERKVQTIRDEMLIMAGAAPSHTRQIEHELGHKFAHQAPPPAKVKRGRKPKLTVEAQETQDAGDET